ncbi:hypothetical protein OXX69_010881 [Metschnikowia pulcherrima]
MHENSGGGALSPSAHGSAEYGRLESRNIDHVVFGEHVFETWYGNSAYFQNQGDDKLGIDQDASSRRRGVSPVKPGIWLSHLYVCDACFKYTSNKDMMAAHRHVCVMKKRFPPVGKLVYYEKKAPYLIKKVRGFRHRLFCQNLALFGKLFLDDKSVFYNVEAFDFYVLYGLENGPHSKENFRPMGFFSKEVNSYESDNNLACICIFPPFQRRGLGSLLIEFSYALARVTPGQSHSGPEFPLSPFGKKLYFRFWARRLAFIVMNEYQGESYVTLKALADKTGFRKEDVLMALEYMGVLQRGTGKAEATLMVSNIREWCANYGVDWRVLGTMLDQECLLI